MSYSGYPATDDGSKRPPYVIVFDGGAIGNPGKGYGSYLLVSPNGAEIRGSIDYSLETRLMTNNQAEYRTLIAALSRLIEILGDRAKSECVRIEGDSQLVLNQVSGKWKVRNKHLQNLHALATDLVSSFGDVQFSWRPRFRSVQILGH